MGSFTEKDEPLRVAADIRRVVAITPATRLGVKSWSKYLKALCEKVEGVGVLVMRSSLVGRGTNRKLNADEFEGFVIADRRVPIVFINAADYIAAQTFTLAHELAHIWIGKAGIVDPDESEVLTPTQNIESFCNAIATEVLVPQSEFVPLWTAHGHSTAKLAEEFRVSEIVCLRRAFELDLITSDQFWPRWHQLKAAARERAGFGLSTHLDRIATRHSPVFMDAVINDTRTGGTPFRDAARLLSMTLPKFTEMIEGREY